MLERIKELRSVRLEGNEEDIEIEKHLGIKLPIILDSPSGKEVDQANIQLMVNILKRDFSDNQIIIASIFQYDFKSLNVIEIKNRLIEN